MELEGELKYKVEKILDKRTRKVGGRSCIEYLIHWHNYNHADNSWEPISNFQRSHESIQACEDSCRLMPNIGRRGKKRRR